MDITKPLAQRTLIEYTAIIQRAFPRGDLSRDPATSVGRWTESQRVTLRAAMKRKLRAEGASDDEIASVIKKVPRSYTPPPEPVEPPNEDETAAYAATAEALPEPQRAFALLPLRLGTRAAEVLGLERPAVERALETGLLRFTRKGGKRRDLPAKGVADLLRVLVNHKAADGKQWKIAGEILCVGEPNSQYRALWKIVHQIGESLDLQVRPHLLRHAFATRLMRQGAPGEVIQKAMGHASYKTTQRYIHADVSDVEKYL